MGGPIRNDGLLIGPDTTVREAVTRFPGIEAVFERFGLPDCRGPDGPLEPIGFFARRHQVDPPQLLRELNAYAAGQPQPAALPLYAGRPRRSAEPYVWGIAAALVLALAAGFPLGIIAALGGARDIGLGLRWTPLIQAHGHLQVMGWLGLFIAGMAFHVLPRFKQRELRFPALAKPAILLLAGGLALRTVSQPYGDRAWMGDLMVASAAVELAGVLFFAVVVAGTLLPSRRKNYDWYLLAATGWMAAGAVANLVVLWGMRGDGQWIMPAAKDVPLLNMQLYGFVALFILGISIRVLPHFLSLTPPSVQWFLPALLLYNAGLLARVVPEWTEAYSSWSAPAELAAVSAWTMAVAVLAFGFALKLHLPARRDAEAGASTGHVKVIRLAYVWLAVAVVIEVWVATRSMGSWTPDFLQAGAARHSLALGFATLMVFGVGARALPAFAGKPLHSARLLDISFWAMNVAVVTRVGSGIVALGAVSSRFDHIAGAGGLALLAVALFGYNIGRTVLGRTAPAQRARPGSLPAVGVTQRAADRTAVERRP